MLVSVRVVHFAELWQRPQSGPNPDPELELLPMRPMSDFSFFSIIVRATSEFFCFVLFVFLFFFGCKKACLVEGELDLFIVITCRGEK